ncbi:MAG: hypothetical protein U5M53_07755 [Rhodoferax sp.]|nr:hypothetical protein [Rhodoferax sp.]
MVFFGPETGKLQARWANAPSVLESGIACSPCLSAYNHRLTFCDGDNQCLKRIAPDPVLAPGPDLFAATTRRDRREAAPGCFLQ